MQIATMFISVDNPSNHLNSVSTFLGIYNMPSRVLFNIDTLKYFSKLFSVNIFMQLMFCMYVYKYMSYKMCYYSEYPF